MVGSVGLLYIRRGIEQIQKSFRHFNMHGGSPA